MDLIESTPSKKHKSYKLSTLVQFMKSKSLDLAPDYQREAVWSKEQKCGLIDSILNDFDIPKLYWFEKGKNLFEVVDGKQRLTTIYEFMQDGFALTAEPYKGKKFSDLSMDDQQRVMEFEVMVMQLSGDKWEPEVLRDMFLRLQKGTPLNPAEKRKALMGKLGKTVDELSRTKVMTDNCNIPQARFGRHDAIAKIIHLALGNKDIKASAIEKTFRNKNLDENNEKVKSVKRALSILSKSFKDKGVYFKKYSIISVTTAIVELLPDFSFTDKEQEICKALFELETKRRANDKAPSGDDESLRLTALTSAARSDRTDHLEWRKEFYKELLIKTGINAVDDRRTYTKEEKAIIFHRDGGICKNCQCTITVNNCEVDHIKPFSLGGKTSLINGQLLCITCNRSKGNRI